MAGYLAKNKGVIRSAFSRLREESDATILDGMTRITEAGLEYLLDAHDRNMNHPNENDTLAAILAHDGQVVAKIPHEGSDDFPGSASAEAARLLRGSSGWIAIILSDMTMPWYRADLEIDFLTYSADEIKANFQSFFKPITR